MSRFYDDDLDFLFADPRGDNYGVRDAGKQIDKPLRVYRLELPDGGGPWCVSKRGELTNRDDQLGNETWGDKLIDFGCQDLAEKNKEQMGVTEAKFRAAHGHAEYGCDSLDAICKWFPLPARKFLVKHNAVLAVYEVPAGGYVLTVGNGEVVFSRPDSKRVDTLDPITLNQTTRGN